MDVGVNGRLIRLRRRVTWDGGWRLVTTNDHAANVPGESQIGGASMRSRSCIGRFVPTSFASKAATLKCLRASISRTFYYSGSFVS